MSHAHHNFDHLEAPPKLELPKSFFMAAGAMTAVGFLAFLGALFGMGDPARAWKAYLIGFFFFTLVGISGPFFAATQYLARSGWSATVRRIGESFTPFLIPAAVLGLIFCLAGGIDHLYEWPHDKYVVGDELLEHKQAYLNPTGMIIRTIIGFAIWSGLGMWIFKNSVKQDETGAESINKLNGRISPVFVMLMALSLTTFSVDFVMSLHPHWFSTMWTVNIWVTMWQAGMALTTGIVLWLHNKGSLRAFINENHIHDLGKMLFALTVFWAYIAFSQFLLMWYANLPEEAIFWNARLHDGWGIYTLALVVLKFLIPFPLMLPRNVKRGKGPMLMIMCVWLFLTCIYEVYWWVAPAPSPDLGGHGAGHGAEAAAGAVEAAAHHVVHPSLPWLEVLVVLGFAGLFALVVGKTLTRVNIIPIKDPRLHEALSHHQ